MSRSELPRVRVNRNHSHALIAIIQPLEGESFRLVGVDPCKGPLPNCAAVIGRVFTSRGELRAAISPLFDSLIGATLDKFVLKPEVRNAWLLDASQAAHAAVGRGVRPEDVPDAMAKPVDGGRLQIWCDVPGQRMEYIVDKADWAWAQKLPR